MNPHFVAILSAFRDEAADDAAWPNRIVAVFGDVAAPVLGLDDMRAAKRAAGRLKDFADLEELG
jgi:hypothetical protein